MDVDTSSSAARRFFALKVKVDKLNINKQGNIPTGLNNLKDTYLKLDELDTVSVHCFPLLLLIIIIKNLF